ncbi:hypothetical protein HYW87_02760 [Candidatus Roizmanbacteria bacterium]|nr:hypothetical protein [Candidatus Roizmanbacteria bacterium]
MPYPLIISNALMVMFFAWKFTKLPPQIPIFYSKPTGEDQLADVWMLIIFPIILNALFFFNIFIYRKFFTEHAIVKKIIHYFNLFLTISITAIFIKIVTLVS